MLSHKFRTRRARQRGLPGADWRQKLQGAEVDLIIFEYELHGQSCELIAEAFDAEFQLDRVSGIKAAHFRKKEPGNGDPGCPAKYRRPKMGYAAIGSAGRKNRAKVSFSDTSNPWSSPSFIRKALAPN